MWIPFLTQRPVKTGCLRTAASCSRQRRSCPSFKILNECDRAAFLLLKFIQLTDIRPSNYLTDMPRSGDAMNAGEIPDECRSTGGVCPVRVTGRGEKCADREERVRRATRLRQGSNWKNIAATRSGLCCPLRRRFPDCPDYRCCSASWILVVTASADSR